MNNSCKISQKRYLTLNKDNDSKKFNNINFQRKDSSQKRLYNKIKISLTEKGLGHNINIKSFNYRDTNTKISPYPKINKINNNTLTNMKKFETIVKSKNYVNCNKNMNLTYKNLSTKYT